MHHIFYIIYDVIRGPKRLTMHPKKPNKLCKKNKRHIIGDKLLVIEVVLKTERNRAFPHDPEIKRG